MFYSASDPVLMGRTQIVCGGKMVSEDERKRKAGGRGAAGWCYADPPIHTPRKRARTPQEPRTPAGASGAQLFWQVNDDAVGRLVGGEMCV